MLDVLMRVVRLRTPVDCINLLLEYTYDPPEHIDNIVRNVLLVSCFILHVYEERDVERLQTNRKRGTEFIVFIFLSLFRNYVRLH